MTNREVVGMILDDGRLIRPCAIFGFFGGVVFCGLPCFFEVVRFLC
jgi:hypothetical protein